MKKVLFSEKLLIDAGSELVARVHQFKQMLREATEEFPNEPRLLLIDEQVEQKMDFIENIGELNARTIVQELCIVDGLIAGLRNLAMDLLDKHLHLAEAAE